MTSMPRKMDNNLLVGLDIGTSKVVAIVAELLSDGALEIIGVGSHRSYGMKKGVITNIDATVQSIQRAIEEAELMSGCRIHSVYTGIVGSHIRSFNSHGIVPIASGEVTQDDVDKVIDAAKAVAVPADQKILHILPQEFTVDSQTGIHDPIGMSGVRLEGKVHIVTGAVSAAQNIVNCIRRCGLEVDDMILEQLASSYSVLTEDEKQLGVCMLDIGGGTTDIAVFTEGAIRHTAVIPVAGDQVTNDLAVALRTPYKCAEEIKIKDGIALSEFADRNARVKVPAVGNEKERTITQLDLCKVIEPRYAELFQLVKSELERSQLENMLSAGIVLTGGSAQMDGVLELAQEIFQTHVRLGSPRYVIGMQEVINNPIFATGIGLLLYGQQRQNVATRKIALFQGVSTVLGRVKNWFQGNF